MKNCIFIFAAIIFAFTMTSLPAFALQPPEPGMIERMKAEGTYDSALKRAYELGNYKMQAANRGGGGGDLNPHAIADGISSCYGRSLADRSASSIGSTPSREFNWLSYDRNNDRVVDERDILALGFPAPRNAAAMASVGTSKTFALIIDFPDYPFYFAKDEFEKNIFGTGDTAYYYRGLTWYYDQASYGQLNIDGEVYGWYTAKNNRSYYHPNDNNNYPQDDLRRELLIFEAIEAADAAGEDFSQYDNDGDGIVDYFLIIWAGPHGDWATFWWGYLTQIYLLANKAIDGVTFQTYSWQWERYYGFAESPPALARWDPLVTIHETGHGIGLPDLYDYDPGTGPPGGVGGFDMMHANMGDHNCFSKYVLGWLEPTIAFTNLDNQSMRRSNQYPDAVIFMPGFDPVSPWQEFFMAQTRRRNGIDAHNQTGTYPNVPNGIALWHIDANVDKNGDLLWNNSYTSHKLARLMEADGLEEIETGNGRVDVDDFYNSGEELTPTSTPNSNLYDGSNPGINVTDTSAQADTMTADFTLYTSNPPTVEITEPASGTVSGDVTVSIDCSDDNAVTKLQLIIDGVLVKTWNTPGATETYTWNSRAEFNKTQNVVARAWDAEGQAGTDTVSVTVSNAGVTSVTDGFEDAADDGLFKWRSIANREVRFFVENFGSGANTWWATRTSPGTPTPLGSGKEAYVKSSATNTQHTANNTLRSQRINATGFTRPIQVKFFYRARDINGTPNALMLLATTDEGATWETLEYLPVTNNWTMFSGTYAYQGQNVYFAVKYGGRFREDQNTGCSANLDDFIIREAPSDPPQVSISSPADGADVSGSTNFDVDATDDGTVSKVFYYLNGSLVSTDTAAPWRYTRNTLNDDNHPAIKVMVYALDNDDIASEKAEITVAFKNSKDNYPATDDLEGGTGKWLISNDSNQPQWQLVTTEGRSGSQSMGWVTGGSWNNSNNDSAYFRGTAPASGFHSIDLSGSGIFDPELNFYYKAGFPSNYNGYLRIYFNNSWFGNIQLELISANQSEWTLVTLPLEQYVGYSGRILFNARSFASAGGTGIWIDDVSVANSGPYLSGVSPNRTAVGTSITLSGSGFGATQNGGEVRFNNGAGGHVSQTTVTSWSDTEIVCNVPTGAKSHATNGVWVMASEESNKQPFTVVLPAPNLTDTGKLQ